MGHDLVPLGLLGRKSLFLLKNILTLRDDVVYLLEKKEIS